MVMEGGCASTAARGLQERSRDAGFFAASVAGCTAAFTGLILAVVVLARGALLCRCHTLVLP